MKLKSNLGCTGHEILEFKVLRASKRMQSKLGSLDFRRADFELIRELPDRITWEKVLEGRGAQQPSVQEP